MTALHPCHLLSRQGARKRPRPLLLNAQTHALVHGERMLQRLQILKFQATDMPLPRTPMPGIHQERSETDLPLGDADKGPRRPQGTQRDEHVTWCGRGLGCRVAPGQVGVPRCQSTSDAKLVLPTTGSQRRAGAFAQHWTWMPAAHLQIGKLKPAQRPRPTAHLCGPALVCRHLGGLGQSPASWLHAERWGLAVQPGPSGAALPSPRPDHSSGE